VNMFCPACVGLFIQLSRHSKCIFLPARRAANHPKLKTLAPSKKRRTACLLNSRRSGERSPSLHLSSNCATFIILMTTVSCSRPDMPEPRVGIFGPLFSSPVIDTADQQVGSTRQRHQKVNACSQKSLRRPMVAADARAESDRRFAYHFEEDGHPQGSTPQESSSSSSRISEWREAQKNLL